MLVVFLLVVASTINAQDNKLTNQSILDMVDMGFSDSVIITKIKTSETNFDVSIEALKEFKLKGISDVVIVSIMNGGKEIEKDNKVGIYTKEGDSFKRILPTMFSGSKTSTLASAFSYGMASAIIKSTMSNKQSTNIINSSLPEFYFFFAESKSNDFSISTNNWWFASATSPNEFALVKLNVKKNKRELKIGKVNIYSGSSMGIDEENIVKFNIETINNRSFKVVPNVQLEAGEYCFFYKGIIPQGGFSNQSVFDFSISDEFGISPKFVIGEFIWALRDGKPYRYIVTRIDIKESGIYYAGETYVKKEKLLYHESKCFDTKKKLIASLETEINN